MQVFWNSERLGNFDKKIQVFWNSERLGILDQAIDQNSTIQIFTYILYRQFCVDPRKFFRVSEFEGQTTVIEEIV